MSYGKVKDTFWTDKKVRAFSDDAKMLALYFLTGPHRNILGCMRIPDGYMTADLGWPSARLSNAIRMLCERQFIARDDDGWTLILNQLRHDPVKTPNHVTAAITLADLVPPESPVYQPLAKRLAESLDAIGKASSWHPKAIVIPEPSPEPAPAPAQEPEQEPGPETQNGAHAPLLSSLDACVLAVEAWNRMATEANLPRVQNLSAERRASLKKRLHECGGIDGWDAAMERIRSSPFLTGNNDRKWKVDFDFILKPAKFTKIMEGGYGNSDNTPRNTGLTGNAAALAELSRDDPR